MMRKGTSRRPEHERSTDTPSHDGCLQVKMDAPAGLQRPSEGNPSRHDSRSLIGPQLDISIICRGGQPLVLLQIPALAPLGDLVTIPARAPSPTRTDTAARQMLDTMHAWRTGWSIVR